MECRERDFTEADLRLAFGWAEGAAGRAGWSVALDRDAFDDGRSLLSILPPGCTDGLPAVILERRSSLVISHANGPDGLALSGVFGSVWAALEAVRPAGAGDREEAERLGAVARVCPG